MSLVYRQARAQDLATTDALVVASINDLTERHGFGSMAATSPPNFQMFSLEDDPDGLWIAEDGGDIRGFAWSWVCGDLWFLAQLFVDPADQGRGIGNELIKLTLEHARKSGAAHKALITFTFNRVSQGLYIRHGLFPRMPIYFLGAARKRVLAGLPEPPLRSMPIDDTAADMKKLAEIDTRAVGVPREKHHRYMLKDPETIGVWLAAGSECVGYTYIGSNGHIGPLAVTRAEFLGDAFTTALKIAADRSPEKITASFQAHARAHSALRSITACASLFRCSSWHRPAIALGRNICRAILDSCEHKWPVLALADRHARSNFPMHESIDPHQ